MTKIGIALGGGGIAGCAHVGVLCALEEAGISIDYMAGSSSGALVAALYAHGYSAQQLLEMVPMISKQVLDYDYITVVAKLIRSRTKMSGIIKGDKIRGFVADKTGHARMSDLKRPVVINATDLKRARQIFFVSHPPVHPPEGADIVREAPVAYAVQASLSIPVLFRPVFYDNMVLVDGAVMDNCPAAAVRAMGADKVIAVDLVFSDPLDEPFDSLKSIIQRVVSISLANQSALNANAADVILRPQIGAVGVLEFAKMLACMECGYEHARNRINEIKAAIAAAEPENRYEKTPVRV